ncbi:MAG: polysaccharide biosynthesis/export family protein [Gomphosphaeria aponina SAG 52.96 = DSM 107014]|uniref:Polysaccharide biosynthesis/export family protein n=1 Tax=Gomphosphaeria aponina SAG 52.96 = DSM 107014 TaxID=1521640 RepID=A0A941GSI3_9CHRO|nr:polysaccharide biosynthesis/export family protein [Gomphosphaeria aponina SAG 52.96 = DSM 107014]
MNPIAQPLSIQVVVYILSICLFTDCGVAQTSISLPKPRKPVILPTSPPPRTFGIIAPPPRESSPNPIEGRSSSQFSAYRLDIGDAISVLVQQHPEFNFVGAIDSAGNVVVPILGRLPLVGLTLEEVETKISYELSRTYLQNPPQITAVLAGQRPVQLTVLGEVVRPGYYTLAPGTQLSSVLFSAGGSTVDADLRSILLRRQLSDGTVIEETVDLYTPLITGKAEPQVMLQGGDTIIISRLEIGSDRDYDRRLISRTTLPQQIITVRLLAPTIPSGGALRNITLPNGSTFLDVVAALPVGDDLRINYDEVALIRFDPELGRVVTQSLNPVAAIQDGDISQNVPLKDGDVIVVSRTLLGEIFSAFNVLTQPIRDVFSFGTFFDRLFR